MLHFKFRSNPETIFVTGLEASKSSNLASEEDAFFIFEVNILIFSSPSGVTLTVRVRMVILPWKRNNR